MQPTPAQAQPPDLAKNLKRAVASTASLIQENLKGDPGRTWNLSDAIKQASGESAAELAAASLIHALALIAPPISPVLSLTAKNLQRAADRKTRQGYRPLMELALAIVRQLTGRHATKVLTSAYAGADLLRGELPGRDLTGPLLQELVSNRKTLATYHTKEESAALMAHLAVPTDRDWSREQTLTGYRIADYACGSGTLLMAAYQRVRELHQARGGDPASIHGHILANNLTGTDVLPSSVAAAAANLASIEPAGVHRQHRFTRLHYGVINPSGNPPGNPATGHTADSSGPEPATRAVGLGALDLLDTQG